MKEQCLGTLSLALNREFQAKKVTDQTVGTKEMKIHTLGAELAALRTSLREKESYIASFKRDLSTLIGVKGAKEMEDAVKDAYHKYVKEERASRRKPTASAAQVLARR